MAQIALNYTAAQINAAIAKINSLVVIIEEDIVQLYNNITPIYPRTKAEAVFFDNDTSKTLDQQFSQLEQESEKRDNIISLTGDNNTVVRKEVYCEAGHSYRIIPNKTNIDFSGVTYTTAGYDLFAILEVTESQNIVLYRRGCNTKDKPLENYYDVTTQQNSLIRILIRCTKNEKIDFFITDTTYNYNLPKKTVVGYIKNDGTISYTGTNNRVSWYKIPKFSKVFIKSSSSDIIVGKCETVGQDSGIVPIVVGDNNESEFIEYFKDETIIAVTWIINLDFQIKIEDGGIMFNPLKDDLTLYDFFNKDISNIRLLDKGYSFNPASNNYFKLDNSNFLTNSRTIKITNSSNRYVTINVIENHIYAIFSTTCCNSFTPVATSVATPYENRGGVCQYLHASGSVQNKMAFLGEEYSVDSIDKFSFAPTVEDGNYRTFVQFAKAFSSGQQEIGFGTGNPTTGGTITGSFYLDNAFIIDLTDIFGENIPSYSIILKLYTEYIKCFTTGNFLSNGYSDKDFLKSFMTAVNVKAKQIGMLNSRFSNPGGSDDVNNYFTANDALKMFCHAAFIEDVITVCNYTSYNLSVLGKNERIIQIDATYKGNTQITKLSPYTIIFGKTGTLNDDSHADVGGYNMNTANIGMVVKSKTDDAWLVGIVILPLTKSGNSWVTPSGSSNLDERYDILKQLFDLLELYRTGVDVTSEVNALQCGYASACVLTKDIYINPNINVSQISKNGDEKCFPASMTKMISLLTMLDNYNANSKITIYGSDIMGGSGVILTQNDILYISDSLRGLMLSSSNTLAKSLARNLGELML